MEDFTPYRKPVTLKQTQLRVITTAPKLKKSKFNIAADSSANSVQKSSSSFQTDKNFSSVLPNQASHAPLNKSHLYKSALVTKDSLDKISNFFDKQQIRSAFNTLPSLQSRVNFIDAVVKRRAEIIETEKQSQFEKMMPVLCKVGDKLKMSVSAKSATKNQFKKVMLRANEQYLEDGRLSSSSDADTSVFSLTKNNNEVNRKDSISSNTMGYYVPKPSMGGSSAGLPNEQSDYQLEQSKTGSFSEQFSRSKTNRILSILSSKLKKKEVSPKALVFTEEKDSIKGEPEEKVKRAKAMKFTVSQKNIHEGADVLESDILRFLLKNQRKNGQEEMITKMTKEPFIRKIESNAKTRFIQIQKKKQQQQHYEHYARPSVAVRASFFTTTSIQVEKRTRNDV